MNMPANMPDMPINVPVDDPNADTEWNDILRSKGIIPEREPSPTPMIQEALEQARELAHENRLEGKELDELAELEDEEDEAFLDSYRQKRMGEIAQLQTASVYNQVYPIQKPEWSEQVTEESRKAWVLVLLTSSSGTNMESRLLIEVWRELARRFGDIKFCQIQGDLCIEGYPDRNCPTVLVYKDADVKKQIVTLKELAGEQTKTEGKDSWFGSGRRLSRLSRILLTWGFTFFLDVEKLLCGLGAVKYGDSRLTHRNVDEYEQSQNGIRQSNRAAVDDDDSDWD
ncbi:hypothetical protein Q7P37_006650 [Cladosporium fusiforme]